MDSLADIPSKTIVLKLISYVKKSKIWVLPAARTVWVFLLIHAEIAFVAKYYGIDRFLTVIQTHWIDEQDDAV